MADDSLESNIIIKTKVARPNREGFRAIFGDLDTLKTKLNDLTSKPWMIKLQVDDSDLKRYGLAKGGSSGNSGGGGSIPPGGGSFRGNPSGQSYYRRYQVSGEQFRYTQKSYGPEGRSVRETATFDETGQQTKFVREEFDAFEQAIQDRLKANRDNLKKEKEQIKRETSQRQRYDRREANDYVKARQDEVKLLERMRTREAAQETASRTRNDRREARAYFKEQVLDPERDTRRQDAAINAQRRRYDRREANAYLDENDYIARTGIRRSNREAAEYKRQAFRAQNRQDLDNQFNNYLSNGFQAQPATRQYNSKTGEFTEIRNAVRTAGNAFTGYTVEIVRANQATNKLTVETLTGSRAMRFLGDSVTRAVAKVALWGTATSLVFGAIFAIKQAASEVSKLEEQTVLLARVGSRFAGGSNDFADRYEAARKLTNQIVELTQIYGGQATEAQKAAAIFARAGRDEQETLAATRAALIASKIAEIEVENAAKLLSAAMLQFNLRGHQLLPTLDALNTLSNQYRVSTDDLLQAISRTGAVYADHNGRLSELAALTAVVAQVTARSGSEIGNAFKTISSNLDRVDTQQLILDRLSISTVNFEGEAKSLGEVIFELRNRFDSLSEAQQKQLTLQIAGVRQRNALVAAIKNVDDAIIAENKALLQSGSASEEFHQAAGTLTSALQRLQATLVSVSNDGGTVLLPIIKGFANLIDFTLRMNRVLGGVPVIALTASAAVLALARAYVATGLAASILSGNALAAGFAIAGTVTVLGAAAQAYNTYNSEVSSNANLINQSIDAEQNKRKAILNTANAIAQLIGQYQELKAAGKNELAEDLKKRGQKLALSVGLGGGEFTLENLAGQQRQAQQSSIQKERIELEKLAAVQRKAVEEATSARAKAFNRTSKLGYASFGEVASFEGAFDPEHFPRKRAQQLDAAEAARKKAIQDLKETEQKIADLKGQELNDTAKQKQFDQALTALLKDRLRDEERIREIKLTGVKNEIDDIGTYKRQEEAYEKISKDSEEATRHLGEMLDIAEKMGKAEDYSDDVKRVNKLLDERIDQYKKLLELQIQSSQKAVGNVFGTHNKLAEGAALFGLEQERRLNNSSTYGDKIAEIDVRRRVQAERIKNAQAAAVEAEKLKIDMPGEATGAIQAANEEEQSAITALKDLEAEKALAILEAEKNIAIERKKSADEAARALGSLSAEDKLRVRAQAAYFAKNPNAKISLQDQLNMDEHSGNILGRFFQSHQETLTDAKGKLADDLRRAGFGATEDIVKGGADIAAARRGRTDKEILNDAQQRATDLERGLAGARGVPVLPGLGAFARPFDVGGGVTKEGKVDTTIPVEIKGDTINFQPMIDSFEKAVGVIMDQKVAELAKEVERIADQQRNLSQRTRPQRYGGNGSL